MVTDPESPANPYDSPVAIGQLLCRFKIARWVLLALAAMLILFSLPVGWHTLELANQEYLQLWNSRRAIYDIEING